jgi:prophage regulatory protein
MAKALQRTFRRKEVERITGLSCSTIYELMADDEFPKPIPLARRSVGWLEDEIIDWQKKQIAAREGRRTHKARRHV